VLKSAMPSPSRVLIPEVLPAVMPQVPVVPDVLPAAPPAPALPSSLPADLPAEGRQALAAALAGPVPGAQRKAPGKTVLAGDASPLAWDDAEMKRFCGFLRSMSDQRDHRGRRIPLDYLTAVAVAAGAAGDDSAEGAAAWAASAPDRVLHRLGAPRDAAGKPRRPDAATFSRVLGDPRHAQQVDDALCAWAAARARDLRPGMRRHLRIDGKALRGAARGGHAPMLLSGLWDDGTTAAQLPVNAKKENEIPVFRDLLDKIPPGDLEGAVISADQMHTQRRHVKKIGAAGAFFIFTIGGNQQKLFDAADALPWRSFAGGAWTVDRGHGRVDARTIKTLPPAAQILKKWPEVRQVFLVERYSYATDGELLGAVAVLGITSLSPDQAGDADLLAYLRGHWSIEMHHYVRSPGVAPAVA
jgi:predicted transposase YbfD/YdcC